MLNIIAHFTFMYIGFSIGTIILETYINSFEFAFFVKSPDCLVN